MKRNVLLIFIFIWQISAKAQEADSIKYWTSSGIFNFSASQVKLTNWAAGGENSFSTVGLLDYNLNYAKDKKYWKNNVKMTYGNQIIGDKDPVKTDDNVEFSSKYGYNTKADNWYYAALVTMKTQMTVGYKYEEDGTRLKISDLFAPAYLVYSVGFDYKPKDFSFYISPLTGKTTIVTSPMLYNKGVFGLDPGQKVLSEMGGFMKVEYKKAVMENITLNSKLELFSSYTKQLQNIDVAWDMLINMKVNKYISASIMVNMIYDHDIKIADKDGNMAPRTQFKDVLGLGFVYKF